MKGALTITEAAEYISISKRHFETHVQPHMKVVQIGGRVVVSVRELDRWIDENGAVRGAV